MSSSIHSPSPVRSSSSSRLNLAVAFITAAFLAFVAIVPPLSAAGSSASPAAQRGPFVLPTGLGEPVHPYGREVPEVVEDFLAEAGQDWLIIWDRDLDTPMFLGPAEPFAFIEAPTGSVGEQASAAATAFVSRFSKLLGVEASSLGEPLILRLDDGWTVSLAQLLDGVPVHGARVILRFTEEFALNSARIRTVREPVGTVQASYTEEDIREKLFAEGFEAPVFLELVQGFVDGPDVAQPIWIAGVVTPEGGREIYYSATDGEKLVEQSTVLHWDGGDGGANEHFRHLEFELTAYCPDPENMYAIPGDIESTPQPLVNVEVPYSFGSVNQAFKTHIGKEGRAVVEGDGFPDGRLGVSVRMLPTRGITVDVVDEFSPYFLLSRRDLDDDDRISELLNPERKVEHSVHLLSALHLARADRDIEDVLVDNEIAAYRTDRGLWPTNLIVHGSKILVDGYEHSYDTMTGKVTLGSDEREVDARDERGHLEKLVPTIVHHEFGHHAFVRLSGGGFDRGVNEGVADALAGYVSRLGTIGYTAPNEQNADPWSRDLRNDRVAFKDPFNVDEARQVMAGALWDLWARTLDEKGDNLPKEPKETLRASKTAFGLLVRVLTRNAIAEDIFAPAGIGRSVPYHPHLGLDFLWESDSARFGGNNDLHDRSPDWNSVLIAFGLRNLLSSSFIRGDANGDGQVEMADAIRTFQHLFLGQAEIGCLDALDTNDSGAVDISDGISTLSYLFLGGAPPAWPFPNCGWDYTSTDGLPCWISSACPFFPD